MQSLSTQWGLFRHHWILFKPLINAFAIIVLLMETFRRMVEGAGHPRDDLGVVPNPSPTLHARAASARNCLRAGLPTVVVVSCLIVGPACRDAPARAPLDGRAPDVPTAGADAGASRNVDADDPVMPGDGAVAGYDTSPDREPPDSTVHGGPRDATADSAPELQAIRIIRGEPRQTTWFDLTLVASDLQEYEGAVVNARIGSSDRPPERLGSGQARILGGAFEMVFPDVLEPSLYKFKRFFIDVNGNGACDTGEPVYSDARFATADLILTIGPGPSLMANDGNRCSVFAMPWPEQ